MILQFWREKPLTELSDAEWESLCDGCGKCCLNKIEDIDTGELFFTRAACRLLDLETCRCSDYGRRTERVPECLKIREDIRSFGWLPSTCAYRLLLQGDELPSWHPLLTGDAESVHRAGISVRNYAISEEGVDDLSEHVLEWLE